MTELAEQILYLLGRLWFRILDRLLPDVTIYHDD